MLYDIVDPIVRFLHQHQENENITISLFQNYIWFH